ncbi:MAG: hypothetical protein JWR08_2133 [Enterovirga sp.]|nr:hypothetical protein [Enterovirga sp.]
MPGQDHPEDGSRQFAVIERDVPATGWQEIDLDRTLGRLPRPGAESTRSLAVSGSARVLSFPETPTHLVAVLNPVVARRVPQAAFVSIGRTSGAGRASVPSAARRGPGRSANDNVASSENRSVWRDLFFLAILAATVVGAFWSGRVHGLQKVIVVPESSSVRSVVT